MGIGVLFAAIALHKSGRPPEEIRRISVEAYPNPAGRPGMHRIMSALLKMEA